MTRENAEAAWEAAGRTENGHGMTRVERFDARDDGAKRLAAYMNKQKKPGRWWSHSRNLKAPAVKKSDRKMSRRRMALVAADVQKNGRAIFEALYPGYRVVELPDVKYSDFMAGAYIYCRMRRKE